MLYQEFQSLKLHWDMFRGALARWRDEDEGVTTLEMVIIGGFLIACAGLLVAAFNGVWDAHKGQITTPITVTPSK
jgi:Flp pilus assembly protein TadG